MKSRLSLKNSVSTGLSSLLLASLLSILGCSSSTEPTFQKDKIDRAITDICKKEYGIDIKVTLTGSTLWVYFPTKDIVEETDKPEKTISIFSSEFTQIEPKETEFKIDYIIKPIEPKEELQKYRSNKQVGEKINKIWSVLRRVVFSMDKASQKEPQFYSVISADIKNGFEIEELAYYLDLKKFSYGLMSVTEYQHRSVQEIKINPEIIGDKEGKHLIPRDITMGEFIAAQIKHRMKLRFQKPEAARNIDIDKEVLNIAVYTIKAYNYSDFDELEINNLFSKNKIVLNRAAVLLSTGERLSFPGS